MPGTQKMVALKNFKKPSIYEKEKKYQFYPQKLYCLYFHFHFIFFKLWFDIWFIVNYFNSVTLHFETKYFCWLILFMQHQVYIRQYHIM